MSSIVNQFIAIYCEQRKDLDELKCKMDRSRSECEAIYSQFALEWITAGAFLGKLSGYQTDFAKFRIKERRAKEAIEAMRKMATQFQTIDQAWLNPPENYLHLKKKINSALFELVRRIEQFFQEEILFSWNLSKTTIEKCLKSARVGVGWLEFAYEKVGWPRFEEWIRSHDTIQGPPYWGAAAPLVTRLEWDTETALLSQAYSKIQKLVKAHSFFEIKTSEF